MKIYFCRGRQPEDATYFDTSKAQLMTATSAAIRQTKRPRRTAIPLGHGESSGNFMLTIPQLTSVLQAAPMPLYVEEQILDQVLGYHDDLHKPSKATPKHGTPMHERVAEARKIGAFDFVRELPSGDLLYRYCKGGEPTYALTVRGIQPVHCSCPIFRVESARDPDYDCKHCLLFIQQEQAEALIEAYAEASADWARAACWRHLGRITDDEANAVYARMEAARAAARKVVCP